MQISIAKQVVENVLKKLGIAVRRIEVVAGDPHPIISVTTPDSRMLIGVQGEHLRSLNYLVKKIVETKQGKGDRASENSGFLIDINGYHRKHISELKQQARILAERARTYKADVAMPPLNPYERMIIHATYAHDTDITTESAGFGKERHIIFKCRKNQDTLSGDKALFAEEANH